MYLYHGSFFMQCTCATQDHHHILIHSHTSNAGLQLISQSHTLTESFACKSIEDSSSFHSSLSISHISFGLNCICSSLVSVRSNEKRPAATAAAVAASQREIKINSIRNCNIDSILHCL